ncbi:MAG: hypothetical protein M3P24_07580, partial [Gemmatimonadota bacterium]|nr:hypothetical protein [Gemmatimonadota bacterium]
MARARSVGRKLLAAYVQHSLARHYRRLLVVPEGVTDVERLLAVLHPVRSALLTQMEIPHSPAGWQVFLAGVGYCDQVNGVAAEILASDFPAAQIFALIDPAYG